jgi:hypothetical protein
MTKRRSTHNTMSSSPAPKKERRVHRIGLSGLSVTEIVGIELLAHGLTHLPGEKIARKSLYLRNTGLPTKSIKQ